MTTMLLDDKLGEGLSDDEESALIEIMTCCCRQAATGQGPPGRFVKRVCTVLLVKYELTVGGPSNPCMEATNSSS